MNSLAITLNPTNKKRTVSIELDAERFERLAANLGLFRKEFVASIDRAEHEISRGNVRHLRNLKDLRRS